MHLLALLKSHSFSLSFLALLLNSVTSPIFFPSIETLAAEQSDYSVAQNISKKFTYFNNKEALSSLPDSPPSLSTNSFLGTNFFTPYQVEIRENLPDNTFFRLPTHLQLLNAPEGYIPEDAALQIVPNLRGDGLMVSLRLCSTTTPAENCVIGHFSTQPLSSSSAQADLAAHQSIGYPITLAPGIQAHFREYRDGPIAYASLMWEQDGQFYRIQFPAAERQNMLYMALEMINNEPLYPSGSDSSSIALRNGEVRPEPTIEIISSASSLPTETVTDSSTESINRDSLYISESSIFSDEEMRGWLAQIQTLNQNAPITELRDRITQEYINRGYITSTVNIIDQDYLPPEFDNGIGIVEGFVSDICVMESQDDECSSDFAAYIRSRLDLVGGPPLNLDRLEEKLRLLRLDPLFSNIEATLRPTTDELVREQGGIDLVVRVTPAQPFIYNASINNDSAPSIGAEQFELGFTYLNPGGFGDSFSANYAHSFAGGLDYFETVYQVPLSPTDTTLRLSGAWIGTNVVEEPFNQLGVSGNTNRYAVWLRQPLIRTPQEELGLSLGFTRTAGQTFLFDRLPTPFGFGPDANGFSSTSVISFAQDYVFREPDGAWAFTSQFNLGTRLFNATENPAPIPDGQFFSWQGLAQRVQRIGLDHLLIATFNVQLTPQSLLPSESFTIGGVNSVRGYRQGARSGDNGLRFSLEDRITVQRDGAGRPVFILTPFLDLGSVWNHPTNPNVITGQSFLMGSGLGMILQNIEGLEGVSFRLNYGIPIINMSDRGNNLQDSGFYFGVDYNSAPNQ